MFALPAVMFTVAPFMFFFAFPRPDGWPPDYFPAAFWIFAAFCWYDILTLPHRIVVSFVGQLEFVSLLRRWRFSVHDVLTITPGRLGLSFAPLSRFTLKHRNGKLRFVNQFTGMHEFLSELRRAQPTVEFVGC